MTIFELAIARHANDLLEERKSRYLTWKEEAFLVRAEGLLSRMRLREQAPFDKTSPQRPPYPRD